MSTQHTEETPMSSEPAPSATTVAELKQTVSEQSERIDDLEGQLEAKAARVDALAKQLETVKEHLYGETGVADNSQEAFVSRNGSIIDAIQGDAGVAEISESVRQRMLPIHQMWMDVRTDNADELGNTQRRAARLFGEFIKAAGGDGSPAVDCSYTTYSMTGGDAGDLLKSKEIDPPASIDASQTVKRVMEAAERLSQVDGDAVLECTTENGTRRLAVEQARFDALMKNVEEAINGEVTVGTDDSGNSDEAADAKARKKMDELERGSR